MDGLFTNVDRKSIRPERQQHDNEHFMSCFDFDFFFLPIFILVLSETLAA